MFGFSLSKKKNKGGLRSRLTALVLCFAVLAPMAPAALVPSASAAEGDVPYYQAPMEKLTSWEVLSGYPDGELHPERPVTRAEFVAMVNRAYGYDEVGETPFTDVPEGAWFADDIGIAYNMGYFSGTTETTASPNAELTREQAMVLLAHNMRLEPVPGEVTQFTDGRDFSNYSKGYVQAAVEMGLISGFPDGSFQPRTPITRGQMATILSNALGTLVTGGGEQALGSVYGNLTVNQAGTTLQDTTIAGNLYISGGLGLGAVNLENVNVLGDIIVSGGGEVESGQDSVVLRNVQANNLLVDSLGGQYLSLRAEGDTVIDQTDVRTSAFLQDRTPAGLGLLNISLEGREGTPSNFTLSGNLETVTNRTPGSDLVVSRGTVKSLTMDEAALGAALTVDTNTAVKTLNLDTATSVQGVGDVGTLNVSTAGSSTSMLPDSIVVRPGVNVMVGNTNMDAALAEESSQTPRLLAGYPSAKNIAPTSASAVFSANKPGTVYWAVSSVTDGSVSETELLAPSSYGSPALKSGNLAARTSSTELSAAVSGLTKGGTYYLSAMLVDARGAHSPVKTISFETPDDSVPNFASGSPVMSKLSNTYAQASVTTTKNCDIHWVLYAKGSTAPTANDFKNGSLGGALDSGVVSGAVKNLPEFIDVGHRNYTTDTGTLEELASYDLYFWLNDADNSKSSAVKKVTFITVDKTPPRFDTELQISGTPLATSAKFLGAINERGTVYWVVVGRGERYPQPSAGSSTSPALESEQAKFQVAHGLYGLKAGRVSAQEGREFNFTVSGLKGESAYDLYYVAQDTAGNYSDAVKMLTFHTLDNNPPSVTQAFTKYEGNETSIPYANTDVQIIFSEDVQQYSGNTGSLVALYEDVKNATGDEQRAAKEKMRNILSSMIKLYDMTKSNAGELAEEKAYDEDFVCTNPGEWLIDYREAKIELNSDNQLVVTFPYNDQDGAIRLSSGASYQFRVEDVADTADKPNPMGAVSLDRFKTISAQISLDALNMTKITTEDGDSVIADAVFRMTPISTSTVDPALNWDLLLMADTSVDVVLYRTEVDAKNSTDFSSATWEQVNSTPIKIIHSSNTTGTMVGKSLYNDFETYGDNERPSIKATLDEEKTYAYAVHITSHNGTPEGDRGENRGTWPTNVKFLFGVVSGDTQNLRLFTANVTKAALDGLKSGDPVSNIGTRDFELTAPFSDKIPPTINSGFPTFAAGDIGGDISVKIGVQLSRPNSRLFYMVAPLGSYPTTLSETPEYGGPTEITLQNYPSKADLEEVIPTSGTEDSNVEPPIYVSSPTSLEVVNPNVQGNNAIKVGDIHIPNGTVYFDVGTAEDPLEPETTYLVYLVTKGTGPYYSEQAQVYTFTTDPLIRPIITLNPGTTSVDVTTNINANINYKLFRMPSSSSDMDQYLISTFCEDGNLRDLTSREKTKYAGIIPGGNADTITTEDVVKHYVDTLGIAADGSDDSTSTTTANMTCLQAMATNFKDTNRSLFDEFAGDYIKGKVDNFIRQQDSSEGGLSIPPVSAQTTANKIHSTSWDDEMDNTGRYVFLISASSTQFKEDVIPGEALSFRAYYYLRNVDTTPLQISFIGAGLAYNEEEKTINGELLLQFNKQVYYDPNKVVNGYNVYYPVVRAESDSSLGTDVSTYSMSRVFLTGSVLEVAGADTAEEDDETPIQSMIFNVTAATPNVPMTAVGGICTNDGRRPAVPLSITLAVSQQDGIPTVEVKIPREWDGRTI